MKRSSEKRELVQLDVGGKLVAKNNRSNRKEPILCVVHGGGCSSEVIDEVSAKTITTRASESEQ